MAKFSEMPASRQVLIIAAVFVLLSGAAYWFIYKAQWEQNKTDQAALDVKLAENEQLRGYAPKLAEINARIENMRMQLERTKTILPDEKLADQFMHLIQETAATAGVEIRRYTSRPQSTKEFYMEAPFEMELDGPFYSVVNFFDKVGHLERIINVSGLKMGNLTKGGDAGARRRYQYAPTESVIATCTTTTFFSKEALTQPAAGGAAAAPAKK